MQSTDLPALLPPVIALVHQAGDRLAAEFARPAGPRYTHQDSAPIDRELELDLRAGLTALFPARFVGEESGIQAAAGNGFCWVVDPHDGTRAFLEGRRGSAVSVALLRQGTPVLGVVHAPLSPDRGSDLIAWAEGAPITRNGVPVTTDLTHRRLTRSDIVFLNHGAGQRPVWNATRCAPARFMPLPSIAYRLARVAAGDGIATVTLRPVNAHDIAAGHALLRAAGGILVTEAGTPVTYTQDGSSRPSACFGGAPDAVHELRRRTWSGATESRREPRQALAWPRPAESLLLDRAFGCMLGQVIGDSLGSQVEFRTQAQIARAHPDGVRDLNDSPVWDTLAGQPTDDSELALALARAIVTAGAYDAEAVATAYAAWYGSPPFDCGGTTATAFSAAAAARRSKAAAAQAAANQASQANGSLMRIAPVGIIAATPAAAARLAAVDSTLSHPHPVCQAACAAFAAAISAALNGADRPAMLATALATATAWGVAPVIETLRRAAAGTNAPDFQTQMGWVLIALQNAFFHLAAGTPVEAALIQTVGQGGDTDTNGAIAGALLGAADGRTALPQRWIGQVLTCRPDRGLHPARPRPDIYWPDDLLDLTEALLLRRTAS
jgi:ADP-ribosyl-[dinitrogen reductase] hydrolase